MSEFELDTSIFDNIEKIEQRVSLCEKEDAGKLKKVLSYLFLINGPVNLLRKTELKPVEKYLSKAEVKVAWWLSKLTTATGNRKLYGRNALMAFREAKGKCKICGFTDVRCLEIDHINSFRHANSPQQCICANCHKIETYSRQKEKIE